MESFAQCAVEKDEVFPSLQTMQAMVAGQAGTIWNNKRMIHLEALEYHWMQSAQSALQVSRKMEGTGGRPISRLAATNSGQRCNVAGNRWSPKQLCAKVVSFKPMPVSILGTAVDHFWTATERLRTDKLLGKFFIWQLIHVAFLEVIMLGKRHYSLYLTETIIQTESFPFTSHGLGDWCEYCNPIWKRDVCWSRPDAYFYLQFYTLSSLNGNGIAETH